MLEESSGSINVKCHYTIYLLEMWFFLFIIVSKILPCCYCFCISFLCVFNILWCECTTVSLFNPFYQWIELLAVLSDSENCPEAHRKEVHGGGMASLWSKYLALQDNLSMFHQIIYTSFLFHLRFFVLVVCFYFLICCISYNFRY